MAEVVTFGEIMMRFVPEGYMRFAQADNFGAIYFAAITAFFIHMHTDGHQTRFRR